MALNEGMDKDALNKRLRDRWAVATWRHDLRQAKWLRNIRFREGKQWLTISAATRTLVDRTLPIPDFPRTITNRIAPIAGDLASFLVSGELPLNNAPGTKNADDIATAKACDRFDDVLYKEAEFRKLKRELSNWIIDTGNGFLLPYYDYDAKWGMHPVEFMSCPTCGGEWPAGDEALEKTGGACPKCTEDVVEQYGTTPEMVPEILAGMPPLEPTKKEMPIGRFRTDVCSPFEIYWDNRVRITQPHRWFFRRRRIPLDKAREMFPDVADQIKEDMVDAPMVSKVDYLEILATLDTTYAGSTASGKAEKEKNVSLYTYYEEPCPEYPNGLCVSRIGADLIAEVKDLPIQIGAGERKGTRVLGLVHFYDLIVSGSAWGKSRLDDLCHMNVRRNIVEGCLQLTVQRMGGPKLLVAQNSGVKNVVGEAGQILEFKPINFGGSAIVEPKYLEAALGNVAPLVGWMDALDGQMETIAGTRYLQGGDVPTGVTAASALALIEEKAVRALANLKEQWVEGWAEWKELGLEIMRQHMTDDRMLMVLGRNKQWELVQFKKADLSGAVDVRIDYEALMPKSQATRRANIFQLGQMALIDPADPEQVFEVQSEFGLTNLRPSTTEATEQAMREFDGFITKGELPIFTVVQAHAIHYARHVRDMATQEFEILYRTNQALADQFIAHALSHQTALVVAQAALAPPPPEEQGGDKGSQKGSQKGSAEGSGVQQGEPAAVEKGRAAAGPDELVPDEAVPAGT